MKKLSLYVLTGMMTLGLASCTDDYTDWASPQTNPQDEAVKITGFQAQNIGSAIDLSMVESDSVNMFTLSTGSLPEGYGLKNVRVDVLKDGKTVSTLQSDADGRVSKTTLQEAVVGIYGKRPVERGVSANVYADAVKDGEAVLINAGSIEAKVAPSAPFIDEAYYLIGLSEDNVKFDHSDKDVYEDSKFSVVFKTTSDNQAWQITTQTNVDAGNLMAEGKTGVLGPLTDGDESAEGTLTTQSPGKGKVAKAGIYRLTIDMWNYTYSIEELNFAPYIYEIGNNTSWSGTCPLAGLNYDGQYKGFAYLDGEFKFKPNADNWDGDWEKVDGNAYAGSIDENGATNIDAPEPGFYMMDVNLAAMTYKNTLISTIGVIGDATPGGWDTDTDMTYDRSDNSWNVTVMLKDGTIKFRANDGWDINWGGSADDLLFNKDNINVEAGTYTIKLILSCDGRNICSMTKE